jgi:hypothetical protein
MRKSPSKQTGASTIVTIIFLTALGYGVYIGVQYVPQVFEAKTIDSILEAIESTHKSQPFSNSVDVKTNIVNMLQVNEMNDMTESFTVARPAENIIINFSYDRELNLGYKIQPMHYEKTLSLDF